MGPQLGPPFWKTLRLAQSPVRYRPLGKSFSAVSFFLFFFKGVILFPQHHDVSCPCFCCCGVLSPEYSAFLHQQDPSTAIVCFTQIQLTSQDHQLNPQNWKINGMSYWDASARLFVLVTPPDLPTSPRAGLSTPECLRHLRCSFSPCLHVEPDWFPVIVAWTPTP